MVVVESGGVEWAMDGYLVSNLDLAKKAVLKDWDMIFIVDGIEGSGKSVLGMQVCKYLDPDFSHDSIAFAPKQFIDKIKEAKKHSAILYDEAYGGLSGRGTMSQTNKALVTMLTEIRQKNLFVIIIQPCFFELDRYAALWRSRALLHVYTNEKMERGQFAFFNTPKKKLLWIFGKKLYSYSKPAADFIGNFSNFYPVDEAKYRKIKYDSLVNREEDRKYEVKHEERNRAIVFEYREGISKDKLEEFWKVGRRTIDRVIHKIGKEKPE